MTTVQKYKTNLNCGSCVAAVKPYLDKDSAIRRWYVDTADPNKVLTIEGDNVSAEAVERDVANAGFKVLGKIENAAPTHEDHHAADAAEGKSFLETYRPLVLVFAYLIGVVALVEITAGQFESMRAMLNFMGGFFIVFSFFKLLNLRGFVDAYHTYDVLARPVRGYGYVYPFIELGLGVAYLARFAPVATNIVTLVVMLVSIVGVTQALLQKRRIQCACLGTVFNLPMTKVTFVEDALMAGMAVVMLFGLSM
ncbi:MAG: copper chaperone [Planctomycetes bacterium]|nr:copper chaperone [Planctomycetota bacterium]